MCCSGPAIRKFMAALEARALAVAVLAELPVSFAKTAACCDDIMGKTRDLSLKPYSIKLPCASINQEFP